MKKWLESKDCYGNNLIGEWEKPYILKRFKEIEPFLRITKGDIEKDMPNQILVDITHLKKSSFQPGKKVIITLSHFLRPCACMECKHDWQYECYLNDCKCCTDECT